ITPDGTCSGNVCTATTAGAHTVTGNNTGKTSSAALAVNAGPLDHLALSPTSGSIVAGGSQSYTAQGRDQYDNSRGDVTSTATFSIAPDGSCTGATCTPAAVGTHTITANLSGATGSATLDAQEPPPVDHIVIDPDGATIDAGQSRSYSAEAFDAAGN